MASDGPPLIRPIPRRPFGLHVSSPTPPEEDSEGEEDTSPWQPAIDASSLRFLDPRYQSHAPRTQTPSSEPDTGGGSGSLSRAQSIMNLTASTLFGIYSPTTWGKGAGYYGDRDEPTTPWGTGAETPAPEKLRPGADEPASELARERAALMQQRRRSLHNTQAAAVVPTGPPSSTAAVVSALIMRAALLFGLGMGYGVLVQRLHGNHHGPGAGDAFPVDELPDGSGPSYHPGYLVFWGVAGVVLGGLLPWFDGVWEEAFGAPAGGAFSETDGAAAVGGELAQPVTETDWALVIRGIGAFVGIVFAIVSRDIFYPEPFRFDFNTDDMSSENCLGPPPCRSL